MVELAGRLKFPAFTRPDGTRKFSGYQDFIVNYERSPGVAFSPAGAARTATSR